MVRRRYGEVISGSGKSHQGRRITMKQPVSSILRDLVKSSRGIAHSDDFEGHKLIQTNFRQLILLDLSYIILVSCVAWPNQTRIGTASNFLQCKWVSCNKSYWQSYDLGWYKDMGGPGFPQPNLWLALCASMSWTALKKFVALSAQPLRVGTKLHSIAGRKRGKFCRCSVCAVCCVCSVSAAKQPRYPTAMLHSNQPETFPLSAGASRPYLPPAPNKATETVIFFFGKILEQRQQQQEEAAAAAGGSSSRRKQQQAAARSSKQQQQQQAAASSSQQQQAAASSSKGQQAAARGSNSRQAVGEQQVSSTEQQQVSSNK